MVNPVSPLQNETFEGFATIREIGPLGMITLRAKAGTKGLAAAVKAANGCALPEARRITHQGENACGWMSPDEYFLILPYADVPKALAALRGGLAGEHHLAVDVSDARVVFQIEGAKADQVLRKLTPADLEDLAEGELRRSRLAQVAAAFWADKDGYRLIAFRSVAGYVMGLLSHAAQKGAEID